MCTVIQLCRLHHYKNIARLARLLMPIDSKFYTVHPTYMLSAPNNSRVLWYSTTLSSRSLSSTILLDHNRTRPGTVPNYFVGLPLGPEMCHTIDYLRLHPMATPTILYCPYISDIKHPLYQKWLQIECFLANT